MVEDNNFNPETEEYTFHEESNVGEGYNEQPAPVPPPGSAKISRAKRMFIPIILVVVIIIVYELLSWYSNRKAQTSLQQEEVVAQKTVQNIAVHETASPVASEQPSDIANKPTVVAADTGAADMSVQQKLDILALRTESNTGQMEKLKDTITQNQAGLINLNRTVTALANNVQNLTNSVQQLTASQSKPKVVKKIKKEVPPRVLYHVKAIVPGMAWLESSAGQTVAVRVGQEISGYGSVRLISPKDGMVITSSGAVIQYGVNDF